MAAPYTDTAAWANLVTTAYDQAVRLYLNSQPMFRNFVDTRPVKQTHPGESVIFHIHQKLALATTALDEITEPTGAALPNPTRVTVTPEEFGNWTAVTEYLEGVSLEEAVLPTVVTSLADNMRDSVDALIRVVMDGSTNKIKEITSGDPAVTNLVTGAGTANSTVRARDFRYAVTKMRGASVPTLDGVNFGAILHPDVSHDLRIETGSNVWRDAHTYTDTAHIYAGELGTFEGVRFIDNPRCTKASSVYNSYVLGREAVAEAVVKEFGIVTTGTVVDPLDRKTPIGWKGTAGWALFRPESLHVVQTTSSVG